MNVDEAMSNEWKGSAASRAVPVLQAEVRRLREFANDPLYKAALADRARLSEEKAEVRQNYETVLNECVLNVNDLKVARAEIDRLQAVVADQALTIGTLKDENGRLDELLEGEQSSEVLSLARLGAVYVVLTSDVTPGEEFRGHVFDAAVKLRSEVERLRRHSDGVEIERDHLKHLLDSERSLTAATAQHTTALEQKVAWFERRLQHEADIRKNSASAINDQLLMRSWDNANPKPGATT